MPLVRRLPTVLLFFIACFAPLRLFGDAISSVTVQTSGPGDSPCTLTSSGAAIQCLSGSLSIPPTAVASGNASASVGSLSLLVTAATTGGSATASAAASYNSQLLFPGGTPSETIVGEYTVTAVAAGDYGQFGTINLSQGSSTASVPIEAPAPVIPSPLLISSAYVAGQPFVISGSMSAEASTPGEETASASVELMGFFDPAGNEIPFTAVPEPAEWPVLGVCLLVVWRDKMRGCLRRSFRLDRNGGAHGLCSKRSCPGERLNLSASC